MAEDNEIINPELEGLNPEEQAALNSSPFKTEIEIRESVDDDGSTWQIIKQTRKFITETGEIISIKREITSRHISCGHQEKDPGKVRKCIYEGHYVCEACITTCHICKETVCKKPKHSIEYPYKNKIFRLCDTCRKELEKENSLTNRILRLLTGRPQWKEI